MKEFEKEAQQSNSSTKGEVDYYRAVLHQNERDLKELHKQLDSLKLLNNTLLGSLSYRVGRMLTLPFRLALNILHQKKN